MKLEEFQYLNKSTKTQVLFDNGIYLSSRQEPEYTIDLYQIDSFYVEVFYHHGSKVIIYLKAFSRLEDLGPYLDDIDLSQLL
jgi:hypothetical protein